METSESFIKVEDPKSGFLSAAELVQFRKGNEEPAHSNIGEKFYNCQNNWLESKAVECALENFRENLKQNRAARKCDLMQAVWNEELNASITSKLKGKFLQHMGCAYEGKVALSAEESLFLLENGCIEILNGNMPLSTEEAYKIMLKEDLSAEKYQVYSQLSQLGFIVVTHKKGIGTKSVDLDKHLVSRKRKASPEVYREPEKKRTSFLGALSNLPGASVHSVEEENFVPEAASKVTPIPADSVSQECMSPIKTIPSSLAADKVPESSTTHPEEMVSSEKCHVVPSPDTSTVLVENSNHTIPEENAKVIEEIKVPSPSKDLIELGSSDPNSSAVHTKVTSPKSLDRDYPDNEVVESVSKKKISVQSEHFNSEPCSYSNGNLAGSDFESVVDVPEETGMEVNITSESNQVVSSKEVSVQIEDSEPYCDATLNPNPSNIEIVVSASKKDNEEVNIALESNKASSQEIPVQIEDSESSDTNSNPAISNFEASVRVSNNSIDIMNLDSDNTEISCSSEVLRNDVSSSNVNENQDDSSCSVMEAGSDYEESNSDVISCLSDDDVLSVGEESSDKPVRLEDDEVELVAVTKKETKPLFVIDLLTDDEDSESEHSGSDDEIQVVKVCENVRSNDRQPSRTSVIHSPVKCKKEEKYSAGHANSKLQINFPECAKKNMVVVDRPPSMYLPPDVVLSKENYVLSFTPCQVQAQRIWNSYRDMQEYQMSRRHNQRTDGTPYRNSRQNFHRGRVDPREAQESNSWNRNSFSDQGGRPSWFNQRNSPHGFSNFPNSSSWIDGNPNGVPSQELVSLNRRPSDSSEALQNLGGHPFNMPNQYRYPPPNATAINSVVSVSNQDMNVSMVGNHILHPPIHPRSPLLPLPGFDGNLTLRSMDLMAAVQRTAYSVATDVLSTMLGPNMNPHMMPPMPSYSAFSSIPNGSFGMPPPSNPPLSAQNFGREQFLSNRRQEQLRRQHMSNPFPCDYRNVSNRRSWNEVREAVGEQDMEVDVGNDVEEVPLNPTDVLWDHRSICPLVKPGTKHPPAEILEKLQMTKMANLHSNSSNMLCLPMNCSLEISYDVYLPGTNYRKTSPGIPKHRIIVTRSTDPLPRYADIAFLGKRWNDGSALQFAVVDNGDISFHSFNNVCLTVHIPHEK